MILFYKKAGADRTDHSDSLLGGVLAGSAHESTDHEEGSTAKHKRRSNTHTILFETATYPNPRMAKRPFVRSTPTHTRSMEQDVRYE